MHCTNTVIIPLFLPLILIPDLSLLHCTSSHADLALRACAFWRCPATLSSALYMPSQDSAAVPHQQWKQAALSDKKKECSTVKTPAQMAGMQHTRQAKLPSRCKDTVADKQTVDDKQTG